MKKAHVVLLAGIFSSNMVYAINNNENMLKAFHKAGINKCDKLIIKEINLEKAMSNWYWDINSPDLFAEKGSTIKEAFLVLVTGRPDNSWKEDISIIQTPTKCFLRKLATLTTAKTCKDSISWKHWHVAQSLKGTDYGKYENKGKSYMYAKELAVGNGHICIQEFSLTNSITHG